MSNPSSLSTPGDLIVVVAKFWWGLSRFEFMTVCGLGALFGSDTRDLARVPWIVLQRLVIVLEIVFALGCLKTINIWIFPHLFLQSIPQLIVINQSMNYLILWNLYQLFWWLHRTLSQHFWWHRVCSTIVGGIVFDSAQWLHKPWLHFAVMYMLWVSLLYEPTKELELEICLELLLSNLKDRKK